MPLNQVAQLHVPEPAHDYGSALGHVDAGAIEKAIRSADLGLNPATMAKSYACRYRRSPKNAGATWRRKLATLPKSGASASAPYAAMPTNT